MAPSPPSFWPVILHTLTHFRCPQGFLTVFKLIHQAVSFTFTLELFQIEYWKRVTSHIFLQSCISHFLHNIRMLQILFHFFIFGFEACRILVPPPGMEAEPPGVEAWGVLTTGRQVALGVKNSPAIAGDERDLDLIPGLGRSPGGGHGNPLQYSCLENPRDRGAWWGTVHRAAKSQT